MSNSNISSVAYVFKHIYDKGVADEAMRLHPTLDLIPKVANFGGDTFQYAVKYGNAQNITSGALAVAQAVNSASKGVQLTMTRKKKIGTISLDVEALKAAQMQPDGAFATLVTTEVDGLVSEFTDRLGFDLFRDSFGSRGQVSSIATNVITLIQPDDARNFKVGMLVSAATGSTGSGARTGSTTVAGLDIDGGTVTLTSAAGITGLAANDFIFAQPEIGSNIEGFEVCTPLVAPVGGDSFRGIDRSVNASLLAGSRINDTATMIEENAGRVAVKIRQNGGRATHMSLNPQRYWEMIRRLGAKVMYQGGGGAQSYGFESVEISTPAGNLTVLSDPDCQVTRGRIFNNESHELNTLDEFVHIANEDGLYNLRVSNDDALETRVRSMSNYRQKKMRDFGVFSI